MMRGIRSTECQYCWNIEKMEGKSHLSDRLIKSYEQFQAKPELFDLAANQSVETNFQPSVVEISFSNVCQFKCVYCHPKASSKWQAEIENFGPYSQIENTYGFNKGEFLNETENPYIDAWNNWWPDLKSNLSALRLTGGEPLLHKTTFRTLEQLSKDPLPKLEFMLNSNLGIDTEILSRFNKIVNQLLDENKIQSFKLYTSLESWGAQAEYTRFGLDVELWEKNLRRFLSEVPRAKVSFMCTYNLLTVTEFTHFLRKLKQWRNEFCQNSKRIELDISYLTEPKHLLMNLLPVEFKSEIEDSIRYMNANSSESKSDDFDSVEINKLQRIYDHFLLHRLPPSEQKNYINQALIFFNEADKRRGTSFAKTFPKIYNVLKFYSL